MRTKAQKKHIHETKRARVRKLIRLGLREPAFNKFLKEREAKKSATKKRAKKASR